MQDATVCAGGGLGKGAPCSGLNMHTWCLIPGLSSKPFYLLFLGKLLNHVESKHLYPSFSLLGWGVALDSVWLTTAGCPSPSRTSLAWPRVTVDQCPLIFWMLFRSSVLCLQITDVALNAEMCVLLVDIVGHFTVQTPLMLFCWKDERSFILLFLYRLRHIF